jgi:hypothetical protein
MSCSYFIQIALLIAICAVQTASGRSWSVLDDFGNGDSQYSASAGLRLRRRLRAEQCQGATALYEYTVRKMVKNGNWQCPTGWKENYCDWIDGYELGQLQCKRKVSPILRELRNLKEKGKLYLGGKFVTEAVTTNPGGTDKFVSTVGEGVVGYGLGMIPTVGPVLSSLFSFFFGSPSLSIDDIWEAIAPRVKNEIGIAVYRSEMKALQSKIKHVAESIAEIQAMNTCRRASERNILVRDLQELTVVLQEDPDDVELDKFAGMKLYARLSLFTHVSVMAIVAKLDLVERTWQETEETKKSNRKHCKTLLISLRRNVHNYLRNVEADVARLKEWTFEYFSDSLQDYSPIQWRAVRYMQRSKKSPCRYRCSREVVSCGDEVTRVGATVLDLPQTIDELNEQCPAKTQCSHAGRYRRRKRSCITSNSFTCPTYHNQLHCINMKRTAKEKFDEKWSTALLQPLKRWLEFIDRLSTEGYCSKATHRSSSKKPEIMGTKSFLATVDKLPAKGQTSRHKFVKLWKKLDGKNSCAYRKREKRKKKMMMAIKNKYKEKRNKLEERKRKRTRTRFDQGRLAGLRDLKL